MEVDNEKQNETTDTNISVSADQLPSDPNTNRPHTEQTSKDHEDAGKEPVNDDAIITEETEENPSFSQNTPTTQAQTTQPTTIINLETPPSKTDLQQQKNSRKTGKYHHRRLTPTHSEKSYLQESNT